MPLWHTLQGFVVIFKNLSCKMNAVTTSMVGFPETVLLASNEQEAYYKINLAYIARKQPGAIAILKEMFVEHAGNFTKVCMKCNGNHNVMLCPTETCWCCGKLGHWDLICSRPEAVTTSRKERGFMIMLNNHALEVKAKLLETKPDADEMDLQAGIFQDAMYRALVNLPIAIMTTLCAIAAAFDAAFWFTYSFLKILSVHPRMFYKHCFVDDLTKYWSVGGLPGDDSDDGFYDLQH